MAIYEVKVYYMSQTFTIEEVEADNEEDAIELAIEEAGISESELCDPDYYPPKVKKLSEDLPADEGDEAA